ncbi:hypothetical protein QAD02_015338 [Eretmocerus hayati]|uniref:Uncharacterized protein n=1 Tax=Eretmocerus hayati TaxID=131215 RepID=A0ACC2P7Z7_9HYME|nr:hypothetical protein QAD02_015338 [Eretmocerus hayati]
MTASSFLIFLGVMIQVCLLVNGDCPTKAPCPVSLSMPIADDGRRTFKDDGALDFDGQVYPVGSFWCPEDSDETRICACKLENSRPCLRKCCRWGESVLLLPRQPRQCETLEPEEASSRKHHLLVQLGKLLEDGAADGNVTGVFDDVDELLVLEGSGEKACPHGLKLLPLEPKMYPEDTYLLLANGSLWLELEKKVLAPEAFCLDHEARTKRGKDQEDELLVMRCYDPSEGAEAAEEMQGSPALHRLGCALSVPFLAVTFFVYALVPELRNIYGKTLMCYVLSLLAAYGSITLANSQGWGIVCRINGKYSKIFA